MNDTLASPPSPVNEPVLGYLPGSPETQKLKSTLKELAGQSIEIPLTINGKEVRTGKISQCVMPHHHSKVLATYHQAGAKEVQSAIEGALIAWESWSRTSWEHRAGIFLKAAELLAGHHRQYLNASTMLGQSKTCHQAEIDSACEMIDFFKFNVHFMKELYQIQPQSGPGMWNRLEYRPLEGFVFAVTPFNFTSIAGNLPTSAALMGNVVIWKPASSAVYSAYYMLQLLKEAGLPDGVIQFLPGSGSAVGDPVLAHPALAGIHFTGSTGVFQNMWKQIGDNIKGYKSYPRIVGETGGKDFVFAHPSADSEALVAALVRGAFEYQGQKCSAASRGYIPKSLWPKVKERLVEEARSIRMGDVSDFRNFMGAVIDAKSYQNIESYLKWASSSPDIEVLTGGKGSQEVGYFIEPTVLISKKPDTKTMCEEIFGPVLTLYIYEDKDLENTLKVCSQTSPYALTGAIFSQDRAAITHMTSVLTHAAGNFYINNKPTGAVVGQQPFGGGRGSGTNDKAGSLFNLLRWTSMRTLSETFNPPRDYRYGFLGEPQ